MTHPEKVRWLMVFLVQNVHEVEEDTEFMNETLAQLLSLKKHKDIAVVGCVSTTALSEPLIVELDKPVDGKGPVFSFIAWLKVGAPKSDKRVRVLGQLPRGSGLQDASTVTGIFKLIQQHFKYDHVLLTTLDHGSGYAIFAPPDAAVGAGASGAAVAGKPKEYRFRRLPSRAHQYKKTTPGDTHKTFPRNLAGYRAAVKWSSQNYSPAGLTIDKLRLAIRNSFGKVDVIFMRNCFMQMFDTGYVLRDVTRYLVAFESLMWYPAYDYVIWLKAMQQAGGHLGAEQVATTAVEAFTRSKMEYRYRTSSALFANDLSCYKELNDAMNEMIAELIGHVREHKGKFLACRKKITDIIYRYYKRAPYEMVDAKYWFLKAGKLPFLKTNKKYQDALDEFLVLHKKMVGKRYFVGKTVGSKEYQESGFSLYFPEYAGNLSRKGSFYSIYYAPSSAYRSREFLAASLWPQFIGRLYLKP
jgi:hypothetical protein